MMNFKGISYQIIQYVFEKCIKISKCKRNSLKECKLNKLKKIILLIWYLKKIKFKSKILLIILIKYMLIYFLLNN